MWKRVISGRARTPVRAVLHDSLRHARRGVQGTARPTFLGLRPRDRLRYAPRVDLPVRQKLPHTIPQWVAEVSWFLSLS